jgi:hypothetical protein
MNVCDSAGIAAPEMVTAFPTCDNVMLLPPARDSVRGNSDVAGRRSRAQRRPGQLVVRACPRDHELVGGLRSSAVYKIADLLVSHYVSVTSALMTSRVRGSRSNVTVF